VKGTGATRTYDTYTDGSTYTFSKDSAYKSPTNTGIMIGYPTQFQGYRANASRQSDCLPDSEGIFPMWRYATAGTTKEIIWRGNDGAELPWTRNVGGFSLNRAFQDPFTGGIGRQTVVAADLTLATNWWETCYAGHNPVEGYWTPQPSWTPGLTGYSDLGVAFPSLPGDADRYWAYFDASRTAITWTRGESNALHPTRRVTITSLAVIL